MNLSLIILLCGHSSCGSKKGQKNSPRKQPIVLTDCGNRRCEHTTQGHMETDQDSGESEATNFGVVSREEAGQGCMSKVNGV